MKKYTNKSRSIRLTRRSLLTLGGVALLEATLSKHKSLAAQKSIADNVGIASIQNLRCEYRINPLGVDVVKPRLSWTMASRTRGEKQTAYQVLVSSSESALSRDEGDLWDTGRVLSGRTNQVVYSGTALKSRDQCFWKVRAWNKSGTELSWSSPASWTIGLLEPTDWKAHWITDSILADPLNRPRTPINCYRSLIASSPTSQKWIVVDLGSVKEVDGVRFSASRPENTTWDYRTILYPLRFTVDASSESDFTDSKELVDNSKTDVLAPRSNIADTAIYRFNKVRARYIRLLVTKLSLWDGADYALSLGKFQVFDGELEIAAGSAVTCSDSDETSVTSSRFLTDPTKQVAYNDVPPALLPHMGGIDSVSRVPLIRSEFETSRPIKRVTLYAACRGFYEVSINGKRIGNTLLSGGYTQYGLRQQYQTYDLTNSVMAGKNAIGLMLGYAWYAGRMNLQKNQYIHGYFPQFLAQLELEYHDGSRETVITDREWKSTLDGPVRWSDIIDGEGYACRKEIGGWNTAGFSDHEWLHVAAFPRDTVPLIWQRAQPITVMEEVAPIAINLVSSGTYVVDMGQEISGWCRLKVDGPSGTFIKLRHSEKRHADGTLDSENLWDTSAEEDYILDGKGPRVFEPHFTWHGFRFVEVTGLPKALQPGDIVGVHVRTGASRVGHLECSNPLFNKLMTASRWTEQNLLFDVPAGCAGRSERLAWTGDIRPCVHTALYHFDSIALFEKFAADVRIDQTPEGRFKDISPHAHLEGTTICVGSPGWADAGVSLPWNVYEHTGDTRVLADNYDASCRWVNYIASNNSDFTWSNALGMAWGDWLSGGPATPLQIGATAFFANDANILSKMADILGHGDDASRYRILFQNIRSAFNKRFVSSNGIISHDRAGTMDVTAHLNGLIDDGKLSVPVKNDPMGGDPAVQVLKSLRLTYKIGSTVKTEVFPEDSTVNIGDGVSTLAVVSGLYGPANASAGARTDVEGSYALALQFDLLDEPVRTLSLQRLSELITLNGGHTTTGFWTSVELIKVLSNNNFHHTASQMMNLISVPSWGYMVQGDGSTCWESFDADTHSLSLNHWTHSAIGEWFWRNVAGVSPDPGSPGFANIIIQPRPTAEVTWCKSSLESIKGLISVSWENTTASFDLDITIPANATAAVYVPVGNGRTVKESDMLASNADGVKFSHSEKGTNVYMVQSGSYRFTAA